LIRNCPDRTRACEGTFAKQGSSPTMQNKVPVGEIGEAGSWTAAWGDSVSAIQKKIFKKIFPENPCPCD